MEYPQRKRIRLTQYDYSTPGAYFVTVCTQERRCILSSVRRGDSLDRPSVVFSPYGRIVAQCFERVENLYAVQFDIFVVMPNHIHFLCRLTGERATASFAPTLGRVVGALKSLSANQCQEAGLQGKLWQRGYYEHVVRNDTDYREIWNYIDTNPARWQEDRFYLE